MVPKQIGLLTKLTTLNLASNELDNLPESMTALQRLETLILSQNRFVEIPVVPVCKLASLRKLVFANNKLEWLPNELTDLNLDHLSLAGNLLTVSDGNVMVGNRYYRVDLADFTKNEQHRSSR